MQVPDKIGRGFDENELFVGIGLEERGLDRSSSGAILVLELGIETKTADLA